MTVSHFESILLLCNWLIVLPSSCLSLRVCEISVPRTVGKKLWKDLILKSDPVLSKIDWG